MTRFALACLAMVALVSCGDDDGGSSTRDSGTEEDAGPLVDSGGADSEVALDAGPTEDAGGENDAGGSVDDAGPLMCGAGVECAGFPTSGYPTNASSVDNCVGMTHQTDCCGARRVFGINHGA